MTKSTMGNVNEKIAKGVQEGYQNIETGVVEGYKAIEKGVVEGFEKITDQFVEQFLVKDGETTEEAKQRLACEQEERELRQQAMIDASLEASKQAGKI